MSALPSQHGQSAGATLVYADTTPPSGMSESGFSLRHPFLEVRTGNVSKFDDGKRLDLEVRRFFLREVMLEMHKFGLCYASTSAVNSGAQELHYRPVASALLPVLARFGPRAGELLEGEKPKDRDTAAGFQMNSAMEIDFSDSDPSSSFTSDGTGFSFEGGFFVAEDGTNLQPRQAVDVRGVVLDAETQAEVARSIMEMKGVFAEWPLFVYQSLHYGVGNLLYNVAKKRYKKFHVMVYGKGWLGCAEIDPVGYLTVDKGREITLDACAAFKEHVAGKIGYLMNKGEAGREEARRLEDMYGRKSALQLQAFFSQRIKSKMEESAVLLNLGSDKAMFLPYFKHKVSLLVGTATYRKKVFRLLTFPLVTEEEEETRVQDDKMIDALARIMFGDRVLKWKLPALLEHVKKRDEEAANVVDSVLARTFGL